MKRVHFKSVAMRWTVEVFFIVFLAVAVSAVALSFFLRSLYFERVKTLGEEYAYEFRALESANADTFTDTAMQLADTFLYKDKIINNCHLFFRIIFPFFLFT